MDMRRRFGQRHRRATHTDDRSPVVAAFGDPTRTLMARGEGELAGAHDPQQDQVRAHAFGSPNDGIADHVRPPLS